MTVSFEQDGSVAVIGLDDGKANAITLDVLAGIDDGLTKARDERRVGRPASPAVPAASRPASTSRS